MTNERDPLIVWLEEVRDFAGATPRAREMAQQAIDRLEATPAPSTRSTADEKIQNIVDEAAAETERGRAARRQS